MKKHAIAVTVLALTAALSACSSKNDTEPTTAAVETSVAAAETETTAETTVDATTESTDEEIQEDYSSGEIIKLEGSILTIMDDFEEAEKTYDISDASIKKVFPLTVGDYVEIIFPEGAEGDVVEALQIEVIDSVLAATSDPIMVGTIKDASMNTVTIESAEDGEVYSFSTTNAYKVAGDTGLEIDTEVQITYLGTPGDDEALMAIKLVAEDSYDSDAAKVNALVGDVDLAKKDSIVLISESGDYFSFISSTVDFSSYEEGETVQVTYDGSISAKEIPATAIIKIN